MNHTEGRGFRRTESRATKNVGQWIFASQIPPGGLCLEATGQIYDLIWLQEGCAGEVQPDTEVCNVAKKLCHAHCPMLMECLARNMLIPARYGVLGGTTYKERQYVMRLAVEHGAAVRSRVRTAEEMIVDFMRLLAWLKAHPDVHAMALNRRRNERARIARGEKGDFPIRHIARLEWHVD